MRRRLRQALVLTGLLLLAPALSGCIIVDEHHCGWWHRC
jgi:hypothetical protein